MIATGVRTDATAASVDEIFKELREIKADRPVTEKELSYFQDGRARGFPAAFESTSGLLGVLSTLVVNDLPDDTLTRYVSEVRAQTTESISKASQLVDTDAVVIVVVGDRAVIEQPLRDAGYQVVLVDDQGKTLATP